MGQAGSRRTDLRKALRENEGSVTAVELDGTRLSEKDVRKLSEALRQNRYTCIAKRKRGGSLYAGAFLPIYSNSVVQKLSLDGCDVTPTGVQHVAGVLCNSMLTCSIRKLSLANNASVSYYCYHTSGI